MTGPDLSYPVVLLRQAIQLRRERAEEPRWDMWITEAERYLHEIGAP